MITCMRCGATVSLYDYDFGHRDECRENRGLVPCDNPLCAAKDDPVTLAEYKVACEHWREHSRMHGCSHGN